MKLNQSHKRQVGTETENRVILAEQYIQSYSIDRQTEGETEGHHLEFGLQVVPLLGDLVRSYLSCQTHLLHYSSVDKTTLINDKKTNVSQSVHIQHSKYCM